MRTHKPTYLFSQKAKKYKMKRIIDSLPEETISMDDIDMESLQKEFDKIAFEASQMPQEWF